MRTLFGSCSDIAFSLARAARIPRRFPPDRAPPTSAPRTGLVPGDRADLDHAALVRAHPDGPVTLLDLDVEAQLAGVGDLAQSRVRGAGLALGGRPDVLDADLEADRGLPLAEMLEGEHRRVALDHRDHSGGREKTGTDRATDVGQQTALDDELVGPLDAGLQRHPAAPSI